jgi:hypothetical protein
MTTYSFALILAGIDDVTIEVGDAIYAAINDASLHTDGPAVLLDFDRQAESLGDALGSAINDVERVGFTVSRVEIEEPAASG